MQLKRAVSADFSATDNNSSMKLHSNITGKKLDKGR